MDGTLTRLNAAWSAVASGIIGLLALTVLMAAVTTRSTWVLSGRVYLLFRAHDVGLVMQLLLLLPIVIELGRNATGPSRVPVALGVASISLAGLLLALGALRIVNDMAYMLPQGFFGMWLCLVAFRLPKELPSWLSYFGFVVGAGLILVGAVYPGLATFVYPSMWKVPAVPVANDTFEDSLANRVFHLLLYAGSLLGVATLPLWTLATGWTLIADEKRARPA